MMGRGGVGDMCKMLARGWYGGMSARRRLERGGWAPWSRVFDGVLAS